MDVSARVISLVADVLEIERTEVSPGSHFFQDLGASSLDLAELIWRLEDDPHLAVGEISESELEQIQTVQDVIAYLEQNRRKPDTVSENFEIAIAADHFGTNLRDTLRRHLEQKGLTVRELGPESHLDVVDFPKYAEAVARLVVDGQAQFGILLGETGVGMAIAANKVDGARAAPVSVPLTASLARKHYDANILCLGAPLLGSAVAQLCVDEFLDTDFAPREDGHRRRQLREIEAIEKRRPGR